MLPVFYHLAVHFIEYALNLKKTVYLVVSSEWQLDGSAHAAAASIGGLPEYGLMQELYGTHGLRTCFSLGDAFSQIIERHAPVSAR